MSSPDYSIMHNKLCCPKSSDENITFNKGSTKQSILLCPCICSQH